MSERAEFRAFLPPIQSAIKWHGSGDSVRFQLEVPRQELAGFLPVLEWTQGVLRVTVEPVEPSKTVEGVDGEWQQR